MSGPGPDRLDDVFAHVDANRDAFVERLAAWVRTPSVSATGQGMPSAAGHARDLVAAAEGIPWPVALTLGVRTQAARRSTNASRLASTWANTSSSRSGAGPLKGCWGRATGS